jgi:hypothetical protein
MARNTPSVEHSFIPPRAVKPFNDFKAEDYRDLAMIGINISQSDVRKMIATMDTSDDETGMDALQPLLTTGSIVTPVQFLQNWLPGFVKYMTRARKIDMLVGISAVGDWEDEQIVQGFLEPTGYAIPYGDDTNVPLASWNLNFLERTIIRFEQGMDVGILEEARSAKVRLSSSDTKRKMCGEQLEIQRNQIGLFGFNGGANLTYGILNDPNLIAYTILPNGATSGTSFWSGKTFYDICSDFRLMFSTLRQQSGDNIDPSTDQITVGLATNTIDYLSVTATNGSGESVQEWLDRTYKNVRIISLMEFEAANAGDNVIYVYAETVDDGSTDDSKTFIQMVPNKFKVLGVQQRVKGFIEDYSNAVAGIMAKRPIAVTRWYGN